MFNRLVKPLKSKSFFLFGARTTGKSTFLKSLFLDEQVLWLDLLDLSLEAEFQRNPMSLVQRLDAYRDNKNYRWVVIDEIQKVPELLDVIHQEIEKKRFLFALTGSSARKLKRGSANLLAGRALQNFLFPLTYQELDSKFDLDFVLQWGSLPEIFSLDEETRNETLRAYSNIYLKEEIQAEQIVRKMAPFRAFLEIAATSSGQVINFSKISRAIGSDPVSVKSYFEILEDTLLGFLLPPYEKSVRKRQRKSPKFYFFDLGVQRALKKQIDLPVRAGTYEYGRLFEQFIILEIYRLAHYYRKDWSFSYLLTKDGAEIDLIIERPGDTTVLLEIKSAEKITKDDLRHLIQLKADIDNSESFCFSREKISRTIDGIKCLHWKEGIESLGISI